jgi:ferritin-like metal-binding protein YciE
LEQRHADQDDGRPLHRDTQGHLLRRKAYPESPAGNGEESRRPRAEESPGNASQGNPGQIGRLEEAFKLVDTPARGKKCDAIEGILAEAKEQMEEIEDEHVLDAGMIGSAQAVEHYEITRYGTLIAWAKQLGHANVANLLEENLKQEKHADELLTQIAKSSANRKAAA